MNFPKTVVDSKLNNLALIYCVDRNYARMEIEHALLVVLALLSTATDSTAQFAVVIYNVR